ncbi:FAD-binding oxidoreductase [Streptomyces sp. NPDC086787]|uniref:FAD-binding oxidoreductase n=1 Tax=Streptomyces sp. NPDC086787 TaxID=3365759 RepID=UPI003809CF66
MASRSKAGAALGALRGDLAGEVFVPGDPGYDRARAVFSALADRRPAVIARCADETDVVRAVRFARDLDLRIAVRGGGYGLAGTAPTEGALLVDLRRVHGVTVDPAARAARVGGGATMGRLEQAARAHGLTLTGLPTPGVGVAGFVLGGGTGPLDRGFGLAVDGLIGVELVTADARRVHANPDENPELFWALHGGGGNFGVVTALTLELRELPEFSATLLLYDPRYGRAVVRAFREVIETGPDRVGGAVMCPAAGEPLYGALLTCPGGAAELRAPAGPLLALPRVAELSGVAAPHALECPAGLRAHWSAECLTGLPDGLVDVLLARAHDAPVPGATLTLRPLGGAVAAGSGHCPVAYRDAPWLAHPFAAWSDPADDARALAWVRDTRADLRPWSTGAACLSLTGDEGAGRVAAGLGAGNLLRLEKLKRRYDPDNVFRCNHNIRPV